MDTAFIFPNFRGILKVIQVDLSLSIVERKSANLNVGRSRDDLKEELQTFHVLKKNFQVVFSFGNTQ